MTGIWVALGPLFVWLALASVGAVAALLSGFRGPVVLVAALPIGVLAVTGVGLLQQVVTVPFGWATTTGFAWVVAALGGLGRRLFAASHRSEGHALENRPERSGRSGYLLLGAVLAVSAATAFLVVWSAAGGDWRIASQTWDAFFDTNAIRAAWEGGTIAPTRIADFAYIHPTGYYPSTFHGLGVLVMQATGADAVSATNVAAALIAGGVWPSTVALATEYVWGAGRRTLVTAVVIAWGFHGMPWSPLGWGVLWATSLAGTAFPLVLAGLAGLLGVTRAARDRRTAALLALVSMTVLVLLHPRVAVVAATVLLSVWGWVLGSKARASWRGGRRPMAVGLAGLVAGPSLLLAFVALKVGRGDGELVARAWPILQGRGAEVMQYLIGGTAQSVPQILVAGLVLIGLILAWREKTFRWLVVVFLVAVALDVATATTNYVRPFNAIARFWYNDRHRTVVVPPAAGVMLAVLGWEWVRSRARDRWPGTAWGPRLTGALAVIVLAWGAVGGQRYLASTYADAADDPVASFVSPRDIAFYEKVAQRVRPGERVLNNPWDGSGMLYAYTGVRTAFYTLNGNPSTVNGAFLQRGLVTLSRKDACTAFQDDGIHWVINGGAVSGGNPALTPQVAPGMEIPPDFWATRLVLQDGELRLYEVVGCAG